MSLIGETPPPMHEEIPAGYQAGEPPPNSKLDDIPLQQVNEEPPSARQAPQEPIVIPAPRTILPQLVQEEPVINPPQAEATLQAVENTAHIVNGEPSSAQKLPELQAMPVLEVALPHLFEEALPPGDKQPQAPPVPGQADIAQVVNDKPLTITQEPPEARSTLHVGDTSLNDEFGFCFACGQKLPSGSFYCLRCGKSIKVHELPNSQEESLQPRSVCRREDDVRPENGGPSIRKKPPGPRAMSSPGEIPSSANDEPALISLRYVQPKYRPVPSRESISEAMDDRAPAMQPFPSAKALPKVPLNTVWPKIRGWSAKATSSARHFLSGQWWLRRLFGKWIKEKYIAPDDIHSSETLKQITKEGKPAAYQPIRLIFLILGMIVFVSFFILIGVIVSRYI
jgi:hypothetical protein